MAELKVVNLSEKFALFQEAWSPRIAGELNDAHIKLAKLRGEFMWHRHENEDELFLVVSGRLRMRYREGASEEEVTVGPGEFVLVPRGLEHLPVAEDEVQVVLIEPKTTLNTGNLENERTLHNLDRI